MNPDDKTRFAAGETDELPPAPQQRTNLSERESLRKDTSYSPASETETQRKQEDPLPNTLDGDIVMDAVRVAPGTGGPDDAGDIEVDLDDVQLP